MLCLPDLLLVVERLAESDQRGLVVELIPVAADIGGHRHKKKERGVSS